MSKNEPESEGRGSSGCEVPCDSDHEHSRSSSLNLWNMVLGLEKKWPMLFSIGLLSVIVQNPKPLNPKPFAWIVRV